MADFVPSRDADLLAWMSNFSALINLAPADYSLTVDDATALAALVSAYDTALAAAVDPSTRTPVTVTAKNTAKAQLVADARALARRIQAAPGVSAAQKTALGLPIHDREPTPVPTPSTKPVLELAGEDICRHLLRLVDETTPTRRARPEGAAGAQIFTYIAQNGEAPPVNLEQWKLYGMATRGQFEVVYDGDDVGKKAWIAARWFNDKGEVGPRSDAVSRLIAA